MKTDLHTFKRQTPEMSDINVPPQLLAVSLMFSITTAAVQHTTQCQTWNDNVIFQFPL